MVMVLTLITALVGAILGSVYQLTAQPIALADAKAQADAIRQVAPAFDNDPIAESDTILSNGLEIVIYPAILTGPAIAYYNIFGCCGVNAVAVDKHGISAYFLKF